MKKKPAPLSARLSAAKARQSVALAAFVSAADELEASAEQATALALEANAEIAALTAIREDAYRESVSASVKAQKIRDLIA